MTNVIRGTMADGVQRSLYGLCLLSSCFSSQMSSSRFMVSLTPAVDADPGDLSVYSFFFSFFKFLNNCIYLIL